MSFAIQTRRSALIILCLSTCVSFAACEDEKTGDVHNADTAHDAEHGKGTGGSQAGSGGAAPSNAGSGGRAATPPAGQTAGASAGRAASGSAGQSGPASAGKGGTGASAAGQGAGGTGAAGKTGASGQGGAGGAGRAGAGGSNQAGTGGGDHAGSGGGSHGSAGSGDHDEGHDKSVGPDTGATCPSNSTLTYANFGKKFMTDYCLRCHSEKVTGSARNRAPADHNFDTLADVDLMAHHIDQKAGSGPKATNTAMPPSDPKPTAEERKKLSEWIACDLP